MTWQQAGGPGPPKQPASSPACSISSPAHGTATWPPAVTIPSTTHSLAAAPSPGHLPGTRLRHRPVHTHARGSIRHRDQHRSVRADASSCRRTFAVPRARRCQCPAKCRRLGVGRRSHRHAVVPSRVGPRAGARRGTAVDQSAWAGRPFVPVIRRSRRCPPRPMDLSGSRCRLGKLGRSATYSLTPRRRGAHASQRPRPVCGERAKAASVRSSAVRKSRVWLGRLVAYALASAHA